MQMRMAFNTQFLIPQPQRNFGASEKSLRIRMKSVNNIRKITKAMKMISSMKMKGELRRLANGKQFGINSVDMIFKTDTYLQKKIVDVSANPRELLVPITSDRGLCGSINSGIVRDVRDYLKARDRTRCELFTLGEKGASAMSRNFKDILKLGISGISTPYNYPTIMAIAEHIVAASNSADKIVVFYNEYKSAISTVIKQMELMPRQRFIDTMKFGRLYSMKLPDKNTGNPALYELYVTSNLWVAFLNNSASEQSARMNAMENASKNAQEILNNLRTQYNKARQARITIELVEIISGASAV
jgi:F-type H+-transporting ATPase subunit gamma